MAQSLYRPILQTEMKLSRSENSPQVGQQDSSEFHTDRKLPECPNEYGGSKKSMKSTHTKKHEQAERGKPTVQTFI